MYIVIELSVLQESLSTASFRKINMGKWAQPLADLNFQRACSSEYKQWLLELRPSN